MLLLVGQKTPSWSLMPYAKLKVQQSLWTEPYESLLRLEPLISYGWKVTRLLGVPSKVPPFARIQISTIEEVSKYLWYDLLHTTLTEERGESSTILASVPGKVNVKASFPLLSCVPATNSDYNGNNENLKHCLIKSAWEFFCFVLRTQPRYALSSLTLLYWACVLNQCGWYSKTEHRKEDRVLTLNVIWLASSH